MLKLKIFSIGKNKESWLDEAIEEYAMRLKPILSIDWCLFKSDEKLLEALEKEGSYVILDPNGRQLDSIQFSAWLMKSIESHSSRLNFVIGGSEGIPDSIRKRASDSLSLSSLTFTHQIARLILIEQIYRAFEIAKKSPYHK